MFMRRRGLHVDGDGDRLFAQRQAIDGRQGGSPAPVRRRGPGAAAERSPGLGRHFRRSEASPSFDQFRAGIWLDRSKGLSFRLCPVFAPTLAGPERLLGSPVPTLAGGARSAGTGRRVRRGDGLGEGASDLRPARARLPPSTTPTASSPDQQESPAHGFDPLLGNGPSRRDGTPVCRTRTSGLRQDRETVVFPPRSQRAMTAQTKRESVHAGDK